MVSTFLSAAEYKFGRDWGLLQIRKTMAIRGIAQQDLLQESPGSSRTRPLAWSCPMRCT